MCACATDKCFFFLFDIYLNSEELSEFLFRSIMKNVHNVHELCQMTEEKLKSILGNASNANQLWEFIHSHKKLQSKGHVSKKGKA